jgi:ABC-type transport system involved in multi-copper enzyme maturation, permease component
MYAVNFLMIMTAVLTPVDTISGEIGSGVIQTLVTKPVRRSDILLGKWLGFWIILVIYLTLMIGGIVLAVRVFGKFTPPNLKIGIPLMLLEGTLLLTLSIAGGTRLSTIANGVMVFGLYGLAFIGGWMEQIGTLLGNSVTRYIGILASLLVPSEALWQLAAYHMQPPLMRDLHLTPFSPVSISNSNMVIWAAIYTLATLGVALRQFSQRNL